MDALKIRIITLGCKVNQCESASLVTALKDKGIQASEGMGPADVYVLNTCSVTAEADRKSRQYISKLTNISPDCKIIVVGCSSQNNKLKFKKNNVIAIGGTIDKEGFVLDVIDKISQSIISDRILYNNNFSCVNDTAPAYIRESVPASSKTRTFIKVQDGCNRFCTYCIIPYLRGRSRSKPLSDIMREASAADANEIVITGVDLSSYGKDIGLTIVDLINALGAVKARKRLGSMEVEVIDETFLNAVKNSNFCPHFHLSLQSGDATVLRSMNRKYTPDLYFSKIEMIRNAFPNAAITTDVIVGFPTETDECFEAGVDFVKKCKFSDIHVFPYSPRACTLAERKYTPILGSIMDERMKKMLEIKKQFHHAYLEKNLGLLMPVYVEDTNGEYNEGYTPNYIKVFSDAPCGKITTLKLSEIHNDGIIGIMP